LEGLKMSEEYISESSEFPVRVQALRESARIINGERDMQYGGPEDNFDRIAKIWSVLFHREFTTEEVAIAFVATKLARFASNSGFQPDSWIDIAGYAGCGFEVGMKLNSSSGKIDSEVLDRKTFERREDDNSSSSM
jgi:hypothetical protein